MSSSDSDDDLLYMTNVALLASAGQNTRSESVHPLNKERRVYGEYHHLFKGLKEHPDKFFQYTRMSVETFNYVLNKIEHRLIK